eukprot:Partr_v1_DN28585_c2_g1_i6_m73278 putative RAB3 GTPase activating protein subunit 1 (Catalytic)
MIPFEINDFSCATPFEQLIVDVERAIRKWKLDGGGRGDDVDVAVELLDYTFGLHAFCIELSRAELDAPIRCFYPSYSSSQESMPLHRWSGHDLLIHFKPMSKDVHGLPIDAGGTVTDAGLISTLLSALRIALSNTQCRVPAFIPVGSQRRLLWAGIAADGERCFHFRSSHIKYVPDAFATLSGAVDLFRSSFSHSSSHLYESDIMAAMSWSYIVETDDSQWSLASAPIRNARSPFPLLPFGCRVDVVRTLEVVVEHSFKAVSEITENSLYSDVDPFSAECWHVGVSLNDELSPFVLTSVFSRYIDSWIDSINSTSISGSDRPTNVVGVFDALKNTARSSTTVSLIDLCDVKDILQAIFEPNDEHTTYTFGEGAFSKNARALPRCCVHGSSAPLGSFLFSLALHLLRIGIGVPGHEHMIPSFSALSSLFLQQFARVLRWHWENLVPIPRLNPGNSANPVDHMWNLLHQKLCMLNYCIERLRSGVSTPLLRTRLNHPLETKQENERPRKNSMEIPDKAFKRIFDKLRSSEARGGMASDDHGADDEDSEPEVFFDTSQTIPQSPPSSSAEAIATPFSILAALKSKISQNQENPNRIPQATHVSRGALHQLDNVYLLEARSRPLMVPIVQQPIIMTSDHFLEQQQVYETLGSSEEASKIRSRMQSAQLLSDMQAFKAANPGCIIADFIRWHSPRDFLGDDKEQGRLSQRMKESMNTWNSLWNESLPIPVSDQKPLFNSIQEGEKALHWLENLSVEKFLSMMFPIITIAVYIILEPGGIFCSITTDELSQMEQLRYNSEKLATMIKSMLWVSSKSTFTDETVQDLKLTCHRLESDLALAHSLLARFPAMPDVVTSLLEKGNSSVGTSEENIRKIIAKFVKRESGTENFPIPDLKEYVLVQRGAKIGHERLFISVKEGDFRCFETHVE